MTPVLRRILFVSIALIALGLTCGLTSAQTVTEVTSLDVSAASGTLFTQSSNANGSCAMVAELTALTGGSSPGVTFTTQTSSDGVNWYTVTAHAACTAACVKSDFTRRAYMRFQRIIWATTGTPASATAHAFVNCFR